VSKHDSVALFVDANVYLSLYEYSEADLEELSRVLAEMLANKIRLLVPEQVQNEIARKREKIINDSIKTFSKERGSVKLPVLMQSLPEADVESFMSSYKETQKRRDALVKAAAELATRRQLRADHVIEELFAHASKIEITDEIYKSAVRRHRMGNPPGKSSTTIGDEINWEALLAGCREGTDLHVISRDGDFYCPLENSKPRAFLEREWRERMYATLYLHSDIGPFLGSLGEHIQLVTEKNRQAAVERLLSAFTMGSMRDYLPWAIGGLKSYTHLLSSQEVDQIFRQLIAWRGFVDLTPTSKRYLSELLQVHSTTLDPDIVTSVTDILRTGSESIVEQNDAPDR
jgi:hypothetical protein